MLIANTHFKLSLCTVVSLCLSPTIEANIWSTDCVWQLKNSSCQSQLNQIMAFEQLKSQIIAASTVNEAQNIAVASINQALEAVENAEYFAPFTSELENTRYILNLTRSQILQANSPQQVSAVVSEMLLAGLDSDNPLQLNAGNTDCQYSTGEVIAIVVGLILGIIPGLILLILLC